MPQVKKAVVSANYKDRESPIKWLMREEDQETYQTKLFQVIKATGVEFKSSNRSEYGFGCAVVAFCESAEGSDSFETEIDKSMLTELKFSGFDYFYNIKTSKIVEKVHTLYLDEKGHMWAQITAPSLP